MVQDIPLWSKEEAEKLFEDIEKNRGKGEWIDIDWKRELVWEDTSHNKGSNTTQKCVSGFANTHGGKVVIGFDNNGQLVGWEEKADIENTIGRKLEGKLSEVPHLKAKSYDYKGKKILVIFIAESLKPIRCDNGNYYYREQSEFKPMPYTMLENKFRESFEEEKHRYLVQKELDNLVTIVNYDASGISRFSHIIRNFLNSGEKLYHFYKSNDLLEEYQILRRTMDIYLSREGDYPVISPEERMGFLRSVGPFHMKLRKLNIKDKIPFSKELIS